MSRLTEQDIATGAQDAASRSPQTSKFRFGRILWALLAIVGAVCIGYIAQDHGEPVNSLWLVVAATCTYLIGYRFYACFLAARVLALDNRATPAERLRDGRDFEPTNKWIVIGHHFAAIAGPGPFRVLRGHCDTWFGYGLSWGGERSGSSSQTRRS